MTNAISDYACVLQMGDGATPENFTSIAGVVSVPPPGIDNPAIEGTEHGSGGYREFVSGKLKELPEMTFDIDFLPTAATHNASTGLVAVIVAGTVKNLKFIYPNVSSTTWSFSALVTKIEPASADARSPKALSATVTLRPTGTPTLSYT
jgi:hypothetical protein